MAEEFKNYIIKPDKIIISIEKDIYTQDMINGASQSIADICKVGLVDKKDCYEITLTPRQSNVNQEDLAILFNDTLISSVSLY